MWPSVRLPAQSPLPLFSLSSSALQGVRQVVRRDAARRGRREGRAARRPEARALPPLKGGVPVVLDGIVSASGQMFGQLSPFVSDTPLLSHDDLILEGVRRQTRVMRRVGGVGNVGRGKTSSGVHASLRMLGFRWLCHLSLHCLPIRPGRWLAISDLWEVARSRRGRGGLARVSKQEGREKCGGYHFLGPRMATSSKTLLSSCGEFEGRRALTKPRATIHLRYPTIPG